MMIVIVVCRIQLFNNNKQDKCISCLNYNCLLAESHSQFNLPDLLDVGFWNMFTIWEIYE